MKEQKEKVSRPEISKHRKWLPHLGLSEHKESCHISSAWQSIPAKPHCEGPGRPAHVLESVRSDCQGWCRSQREGITWLVLGHPGAELTLHGWRWRSGATTWLVPILWSCCSAPVLGFRKRLCPIETETAQDSRDPSCPLLVEGCW